MNENVIDFAPTLEFLRDRKRIFQLFDVMLPVFFKQITNKNEYIEIDVDIRITITRFINLLKHTKFDLRDKSMYRKLLIFAVEYLNINTEILSMINLHELYQQIIFCDLVLKKNTWHFEYA